MDMRLPGIDGYEAQVELSAFGEISWPDPRMIPF